MNPTGRRHALLLMIAATAAAMAHAPAPGTRVRVDGGSVWFEVATNMLGTTVRGRSEALGAVAEVFDDGSALRLGPIEAWLPVSSLKTGIRLRDQHMLKYIFQTPDGQLPDIRFAAEAAACTRPASGPGHTCTPSGTLTVLDTPRPFAVTLAVQRQGDGYRVQGSGQVELSAYGIERPSQLGVRTADEVKLRFEFAGRAARAAHATSNGVP